jgi:predicted permease
MSRFKLPFSRGRARADAHDEVRLHIEGRIDELVRQGMSRVDAEREALRMFGDPARVEAEVEAIDVSTHRRRELRETVVDALRDLRLSARSLARRPSFTIGVIATLALGIGANTAIFSVADALLFRPPPYPHPEQLVSVWAAGTHSAGEFVAIRERMKTLAAIGTYAEWQMTVGDEASSFRANGADISDNLFDFLGTRAALGTTFAPGANVPGSPRVVILSHALWATRFGGDSSLIGKSLLFEGTPRTVVGVMPADFHFPNLKTQLWIPSTFDASNNGNYWGWWKYSIAGRLKPGFTVDAASRELRSLTGELRKANTLWDAGETYGNNADITPLQQTLAGPARTTMLVLLGVVFALLLVACANVANLVLIRAIARDREFAVRAALGSSRGRLIGQLLGENFLLALAGGVAAVALAWGGVSALSASLPSQIPRSSAIQVDIRVLTVTLGLVLIAWLAFGLIPALRASSTHPGRAMGTTRGSTRGAAHHRIAGTLTVVQLALAVVLVAASGLLVRSLDALRRTDPGFRSDQVLVARINLPNGAYRDTLRRAALFDALLTRVRATPGVTMAGLIDRPPLRDPVYGLGARIEGVAEDMTKTLPTINHGMVVTPGYFETMGIKVLSGRTFNESDGANSPWVVVINKAMADRFWPGTDAVGKRVGLPFASPWMTIVGVVDDVRIDSLSSPNRLDLYRPFAQATNNDFTLTARSTLDVATFGALVKSAVAEQDRQVPVSDVRPLSSIVESSMARAKFTAWLLAGFAVVSLLLGAVGIYGVVSYSVTERTRELGLRMALGATPGRVLGLVLGQGARLASIGVVLGVAGAFAAARALSGLLYQVSTTDVVTFVVAPALLLVVAVAATWIPARRAVRTDPLSSLRAE